MRTQPNVAAIESVQRAVEAAAHEVVLYIKDTAAPTSEAAHDIIDTVLATHDCESPEGHIVAAGPASAEPHEVGSGVIAAGVPIVLDIYPRSKTTGYFADMTRTVCTGEPSMELQQMYDAVCAAQELAVAMVAPNVRGADIHQAVVEYFSAAGYSTTGTGTLFPFAEGFVHGLGHGVGREVHEAPRLGRNSEAVLQVGDVITIEPGLYYKHIGGVRMEDVVEVTEAGCRVLTNFPKELQV